MVLSFPVQPLNLSGGLISSVIFCFSGTVEFMSNCRSMWLSMNNWKWITSYDDTEKERIALLDVAKYFESWKAEINASIQREIIKCKAGKIPFQEGKLRTYFYDKMVTWQCYDDMLSICKGVPQFLYYLYNDLNIDIPVEFRLKSITQDLLERDFSILRNNAGGGMNPTVQTALYTLRTVNMNRLFGHE